MLLDGLFQKAHKIFQGYLKLYSNYMNIIQIQIANELNPKSQKIIPQKCSIFWLGPEPLPKIIKHLRRAFWSNE